MTVFGVILNFSNVIPALSFTVIPTMAVILWRYVQRLLITAVCLSRSRVEPGMTVFGVILNFSNVIPALSFTVIPTMAVILWRYVQRLLITAVCLSRSRVEPRMTVFGVILNISNVIPTLSFTVIPTLSFTVIPSLPLTVIPSLPLTVIPAKAGILWQCSQGY
ncbi:hypothetical protein FJ444_03830 [Aestuariibacter sp. GS-14]|uniref:hypothetical protein n=1 Tax=Aestuariibacter sp. GS-14 TaxID=2590670 RepID=UPI0011272E84|nr:hypothetical protein [Aestuariibacter sp. GS-14]TPV60763.1 hypothetical protein FJ444_03830 [Aestuariibacter sp. GS-14]